MTVGAVEDQLQNIIRSDLLVGPSRELPLNDPLSELGLDSLALVSFLTYVEATFGVALPDDAWIAREPLTLANIAALVRAAGGQQAAAQPTDAAPPDLSTRSERVERALSRYGPPGRMLLSLLPYTRRFRRFVFARASTVVVERLLENAELPEPTPPPGVELRPYAYGDDLSGLWSRIGEESGRAALAHALAHGAVALAAADGDRIVALVLLSAEGADDVRVTVSQGASYSYRLDVARAVRGSGVGAALLAYSLGVARDQGFRALIAWVHENNRPMLVTTTHALGFRPVGAAVRTTVIGRTRWSWYLRGRRGSGPVLLL
jgi:acyl carrier protein/GNAT superfamily N-acetyltransferase